MHRTPEANGPGAADQSGRQWWRGAVFYQVYVRSFSDSNADGVGDLAGIRSRLGYLSLLGVDALWITPFYPSPMADHGYDVADARDVDPLFGNLDGFEDLVSEAHEYGIRVTVDLVPNHTSDRHPWFESAAVAAPGDPVRDRYHIRAGLGPDGASPPNNWESLFGGPAWTRLPDGQWYLHLFAPEQPDLNWDHPEVLGDLERTLRFWMDRGVDGFRVDVAHGMAKEPGLPDMDPIVHSELLRETPADPRLDNDGVHDIHRMIRRVLDGYPGRMAVGEVWVRDDERLGRYARRDELHMVFDFRFAEAEWNAEEFANAIAHALATVRDHGAPPVWVLSNHDMERPVSRFGGGEIGRLRARAAALLQLALPGTAYLYNGDELGLPNLELPDELLQDPMWERSGHTERGRDGERIPMPWAGETPPYDFTTGASTWLPMPELWGEFTVETQSERSDSMLSLYRRAIEIRREHPATEYEIEWFGAPDDCLAFRRADGLVCALNASNRSVPLPPGEVLLASSPLDDDGLPPDTTVWLWAGRDQDSSPGAAESLNTEP